MKCLVYNWLYRHIRFTVVQSFLMRMHLSTCPRCKEVFASEADNDWNMNSVGYSATNVQVPADTWESIESQLLVRQRHDTPRSVSPPKRVPGFSWKIATAAGVAFLLMLLLNPFPPFHPDHNTNGKPVTVQTHRIVVHSIKVDGRPAQTVYFQPEDENCLIVWVR